ncbi:MAG: hypothetical protein WCP19_09330 [Chloroflexota bacterium]
MLDSIKLACYQVLEAFSEGGIKKVLQARVFINRIAVPAVMELSGLSPLPPLLTKGDKFQYAELNVNDLLENKYSFVFPGRYLKAARNLKRGWRGFAVISHSFVVGDMWCQLPGNNGTGSAHNDLKMLGIDSGQKDVYAFDMFIAPSFRGKNLAVPLQKFVHLQLKSEGFEKVFGFYWKDNLPALWMHRMLKYSELPARRINRFFFLVNSRPVNNNEQVKKFRQKSYSQ